jgi:hypothetical protein
MNETHAKVSRRRVFAGVGTAGAVAAVAAVAPALDRQAAEPADAAAKPEKGGGYRLTQHVLRYYQTTRI